MKLNFQFGLNFSRFLYEVFTKGNNCLFANANFCAKKTYPTNRKLLPQLILFIIQYFFFILGNALSKDCWKN